MLLLKHHAITVSSNCLDDLTDINTFTSRQSSSLYGKTKLLNIMFTGVLSRKLEGTGVTVNALNPGFNVTGLGRELWFASTLEHILKFLHIGDPRRGADIILRLALEKEYEGVTGGYFNVGTGKPIIPVQPAGNTDIEDKLWNYTKELLEINFLAQV